MAKPDESESLSWGTLEELLLACAIHRYGTDSWDSVARELQKRSSTASNSFTSRNCKRKYYDLKRRFDSRQPDLAGSLATEDGSGGDAIPWLHELRTRRIAELKRDLERYDLSIGSLQLKLKRLSEEREKSLTENERKSSDLRHRERGDGRGEEEENQKETPSLPLPESNAVDQVPAVKSDREIQSVNASDSSDPKGEKSREKTGERKPDPPADSEEGTAKSTAGEDSYNGSSETIVVVKGLAKTEPVCNSPVLVESVAESKRRREEDRLQTETSEVQSSASLSEKKGRLKSRCLKNSGNEAVNQYAADKSGSVKPRPLADLLDVIRLHKSGSVFERRLDSQESSEYKNMIRQHVDVATIRKRVEEGAYSGCHSKLHRDLLLLATNAALFFPKRSLEHKSAIELRRLVSSKLPRHPIKPKLEFDSDDSSPLLTIPVVAACRKRSSIALKSSSSGEKKNMSSTTVTKKRTRDQTSDSEQQKTSVDDKNRSKSSNAETGGCGKKSGAGFLNRIRRKWTDPSESAKRKEKKGANKEDSKTEIGRPPKRAAAVAGTKKRRSDGGGGKAADDAQRKKRSRK